MAVSGTYKMSANSPMGRIDGLFVLKAEGDALTGTMTGMGNTIEIENGRAEGDDFEFDVSVPLPMGPMKIAVKGAVDGDSIAGSFVTGFGQLPFEGTRTGE